MNGNFGRPNCRHPYPLVRRPAKTRLCGPDHGYSAFWVVRATKLGDAFNESSGGEQTGWLSKSKYWALMDIPHSLAVKCLSSQGCEYSPCWLYDWDTTCDSLGYEQCAIALTIVQIKNIKGHVGEGWGGKRSVAQTKGVQLTSSSYKKLIVVRQQSL